MQQQPLTVAKGKPGSTSLLLEIRARLKTPVQRGQVPLWLPLPPLPRTLHHLDLSDSFACSCCSVMGVMMKGPAGGRRTTSDGSRATAEVEAGAAEEEEAEEEAEEEGGSGSGRKEKAERRKRRFIFSPTKREHIPAFIGTTRPPPARLPLPPLTHRLTCIPRNFKSEGTRPIFVLQTLPPTQILPSSV